VLGLNLLLASLVGIPELDVALGGVDPDLHCWLERWTLLYEMVAHEPKASPLREDGRVVVKRPIPKAEDKAARHAMGLARL
jgi:hypothetical protein